MPPRPIRQMIRKRSATSVPATKRGLPATRKGTLVRGGVPGGGLGDGAYRRSSATVWDRAILAGLPQEGHASHPAGVGVAHTGHEGIARRHIPPDDRATYG